MAGPSVSTLLMEVNAVNMLKENAAVSNKFNAHIPFGFSIILLYINSRKMKNKCPQMSITTHIAVLL